jgi:hypothetical protein
MKEKEMTTMSRKNIRFDDESPISDQEFAEKVRDRELDGDRDGSFFRWTGGRYRYNDSGDSYYGPEHDDHS